MKTKTAIGKTAVLGLVVLVPWVMMLAGNAEGIFMISDDATGGDCITGGVWNAAEKTCVLTTDLYAPVTIISSGVTLDGNGHYLSGPGYGDAVTLSDLADVEVGDLVIVGFYNGILMYNVQGSVIDGVTVRGANWGIFLTERSSMNRITGNTLEDNFIALQITWGSHNNVVESNTFRGNDYGTYLGTTYANEIVNNVFDENVTQLTSRGYSNVVEANYWSDDTDCADANGDGLCDGGPHMLIGAVDSRPAATEGVDTRPPLVYIEATPSVLQNTGKFVNVHITGFAEDSKSGVGGVVIRLVDEYGDYDQVIPGFGSIVTLKAKTRQKDYDGRTYTITATATDAKGNTASATATVFVQNALTAGTAGIKEK